MTEPLHARAFSVFNIKYFSSQEECESINMAEVDKSDQNKHVKDKRLEMEENANKMKKKHIQCSGYFQVIELNKGTVLIVSSDSLFTEECNLHPRAFKPSSEISYFFSL